MAQDLVDFQDIYTAVANDLKVQIDDETSLDRIKRAINIIYIDEVVPFAKWWWLVGNTNVRQEAYYSTGTASVTEDSATVTISSVIAASKARHYFAIDGYEEIYEIGSHTAGTATLTLSSTYTGETGSGLGYKIWSERLALPTNCKETISVVHEHRTDPMLPRGTQELIQLKASFGPRFEDRPIYYATHDFYDPTSGTGETESDRYRELQVFPALLDKATTLHVNYVKEVSALDLDGDEPAMPVEDRSVLYHGALSICFESIARNPEAAAASQARFDRKLARMAAKMQDSMNKPKLEMNRTYLAYKRRGRRGSGWSNF